MIFRVLGLMSGTSMDGIDVALLETDGQDAVRSCATSFQGYNDDFRERLRGCLGSRSAVDDFHVALVERELTDLHAMAVHEFLREHNMTPEAIDLIGFHGQTIWHHPERHETIQLGDGDHLARQTGIPVVNDFRSADVKAGGQGAPLVPVYHAALAASLPKPLAVINIGGVANVTWIGQDPVQDLLAFDTGPGNALLDDWMTTKMRVPFDMDGALAASGRVDEEFVALFLRHPYFKKLPPKSLDRNTFGGYIPDCKDPAAGAATLTMMTVASIAAGFRLLPTSPQAVYLSGGGRRNATVRRWLARLLEAPLQTVDDIGWDGDSLEAEAFAYLAVRSVLGLPLTVPGTTGVAAPATGGVYHSAGERRYPAMAI